MLLWTMDCHALTFLIFLRLVASMSSTILKSRTRKSTGSEFLSLASSISAISFFRLIHHNPR